MVEVSEVRTEPGSRPWTRLFRRAQEGVDPAEPWETPLRSFDPAWRQPHPFRPASAGDVPVGALTALETACGPLGLDALLVIPRSTRLASQRRSVLTPTEVLAFGETTVALWIADGTNGRILSVPHRRLAAIVDRHVLLHGRLTLVGEEQDIIIRYNTVARP